MQKIKLVIFGLVLAFGANFVSAQSWSAPTGVAPVNNLDVPVHVGTGAQVKDGGISVDTFIAAQDAQFNQQTFFPGMVRGGTPTDGALTSTVTFGGNGKTVSGTVTGTLHAETYIQSVELGVAAQTPLCADASGNIIMC